MSFKQFISKRPWLRGGLIGVGICVALFLFYIYIFFPAIKHLYDEDIQ